MNYLRVVYLIAEKKNEHEAEAAEVVEVAEMSYRKQAGKASKQA